jgi:formiminotetrahydrofolate cyclodeaminase
MAVPAGAAGFHDLALGSFVDALASGAPVPGGGSASAVAGSLAAALVAMVATLSQDRPRYAEHAALHAWGATEGRRLSRELLALADEDAAAYAAFSAALKQPRETEAQQVERTAAIRASARSAADVPLRCVAACRDVVRAAEALAGRSNVNASSDLNVAALLGEAAARGAAANVIVNLPAVADDDFSAHARGQVTELLNQVERFARETRRVVESGESRAPRMPGTVLA